MNSWALQLRGEGDEQHLSKEPAQKPMGERRKSKRADLQLGKGRHAGQRGNTQIHSFHVTLPPWVPLTFSCLVTGLPWEESKQNACVNMKMELT